MNAREQAQPPNLVVRVVTHLRQQLAEVARECGHAALCGSHSSERTKAK